MAAKCTVMTKNTEHRTREERLAAKLRENLRRRKAQSREIGTDERGEGPPRSQ